MGVSSAKPVLCLQNVSKDFGGTRALNEVSFEVPPGTITGVIGPNGAGKTTLFNIVTGVTRASRGHVLFHGTNITRLPPHKISRLGVARTFQTPKLVPSLTVAQNAALGQSGKARVGLSSLLPFWRQEEATLQGRASEILDFVGLRSKCESFASELPYVDQRLLELARALCAEPSLLLLDEPTAGMTEEEKKIFVSSLRSLDKDSKTIILIEHHIDVVMSLCDRIIVLNFGNKIAEGEPQAVQRDPTVIEAYLGKDD